MKFILASVLVLACSSTPAGLAPPAEDSGVDQALTIDVSAETVPDSVVFEALTDSGAEAAQDAVSADLVADTGVDDTSVEASGAEAAPQDAGIESEPDSLGDLPGDLAGDIAGDAPPDALIWTLDNAEVTRSAYKACVDAGSCTNPSTTSLCGAYVFGDLTKQSHPVTCINRTQAIAYCTWRGAMLPTWSQWSTAWGGATYPFGMTGCPVNNPGEIYSVGGNACDVLPSGIKGMAYNAGELLLDGPGCTGVNFGFGKGTEVSASLGCRSEPIATVGFRCVSLK